MDEPITAASLKEEFVGPEPCERSRDFEVHQYITIGKDVLNSRRPRIAYHAATAEAGAVGMTLIGIVGEERVARVRAEQGLARMERNYRTRGERYDERLDQATGRHILDMQALQEWKDKYNKDTKEQYDKQKVLEKRIKELEANARGD